MFSANGARDGRAGTGRKFEQNGRYQADNRRLRGTGLWNAKGSETKPSTARGDQTDAARFARSVAAKRRLCGAAKTVIAQSDQRRRWHSGAGVLTAGAENHVRSRETAQISAVSDQAVALRRRRLRHPVDEIGAAVQFARVPLRHRAGVDADPGARRRRRHRDFPDRRDQYARPPGPHRPADQASGRPRTRRLCRRPVEPVPACAGPRPSPAGGWRQGLHRRLPCLGLPRDAAGEAGFAQRGARPRHFAVRRRGGGPVRRGAARRRGRNPEADLQLPQ